MGCKTVLFIRHYAALSEVCIYRRALLLHFKKHLLVNSCVDDTVDIPGVYRLVWYEFFEPDILLYLLESVS